MNGQPTQITYQVRSETISQSNGIVGSNLGMIPNAEDNFKVPFETLSTKIDV